MPDTMINKLNEVKLFTIVNIIQKSTVIYLDIQSLMKKIIQTVSGQ